MLELKTSNDISQSWKTYYNNVVKGGDVRPLPLSNE